MRWCLVLLLGCAKPQPAQPTPVQSVSVAPEASGSPNEPTLLLGAPKPIEAADIERVNVKDEQPDASFRAPKDRCPDGVTEMIAVHLALGETMELAPGARPISALGSSGSVDVVYDRRRRIVQFTAKKYGLVFVLTERESRCTWYGVTTGY